MAIDTGGVPWLTLIGSALASVFMLVSLAVMYFKPSPVAKSLGREILETETSSVPGASKVLLDHLVQTPEEIRRDWPAKTGKLTAELLELSRSLRLSATSVVTLSLPAAHVTEDVFTILALLVQVAHVVCIIDVAPESNSYSSSSSISKDDQAVPIPYHLLPMPQHRVIPAATHASRIACIRQLQPSVHIDYSRPACRALQPHVPCVLCVSEELVLSLGVPLVRVGSHGSTGSTRSTGDEEEGIYTTDEGFLLLDSIFAVIAVQAEYYPKSAPAEGSASSGRYRSVQLPPS